MNKELIYVFSLVVVHLEFGLIFAFGAVFVALLEKYQRDRSATATVQSILIGVSLSFGVVSGMLINKLGLPLVLLISCILVPVGFCTSFFATRIEHLYISIGAVSGIGISLGFISSIAVVGRMFTGQKRVLYLSIQTAFISLSGLIYPYVLEWLIGLYGLDETYLLLGTMYCNKIPLLILCTMNRTSLAAKKASDNACITTGTSSVKTKNNFIIDSVKKFKNMMNMTFVFFALATGISLASTNGFVGLVLDISIRKGFTISQGNFIFVILNIVNTLSRVVPGFLKQIRNVDSLIYPVVSAISCVIGQLLIFVGNSYSVYMFGIVLTGLSIGGLVSSQFIVAVEIVRQEDIPVASGLITTVVGVLSLPIGPIFGSLVDNSGSYGIVYLTIASLHGIAAILFLVAMIYKRIYAKKKETTQQNRCNTVFSVTSYEL